MPDALHFLIFTVAGWLNQHQEEVLPPSTVAQAARSSSPTGAVGHRAGTAHVIVPMLTSTDKEDTRLISRRHRVATDLTRKCVAQNLSLLKILGVR